MHKIKKSIQALVNYLGKDTQGLGLLSAVSNHANSLRKEAAVAEDKLTGTLMSNVVLRQVRGDLERENKRLESQLEQSKVMQAQRDRDVQSLERALAEAQAEVAMLSPGELGEPTFEPYRDEDGLLDPAAITGAFNALRKSMKVCPKSAGRYSNPDPKSDGAVYPATPSVVPPEIYELATLVKSYSATDMMTLGRFVAIRAAMALPCMIQSKMMNKFADLAVTGHPDDDGHNHNPACVLRAHWHKKTGKHFLRWFRLNVIPRGTITSKRLVVRQRTRGG